MTLFQTPAIASSSDPAVLALIPARYAASRFPGKPLALIQGKPMIQWVWEHVVKTPGITDCIVATDDARILDAVLAFGGKAQLTRADHPSGTDRIWEIAEQYPHYNWILNVQGDEPYLPPSVLETLLEGRHNHAWADILTLVTPLLAADRVESPNLVKAVLSHRRQALYFSRSPIPFYREAATAPTDYWLHLGVYLYRRSALQTFVSLPPSPLEQAECLEQLRALEAGMQLAALPVSYQAHGIDTPADIDRLAHFLLRDIS
jgi:3-deoxy-D-manno-octulosonate cytidylyltransferase